MGDTTTLTTSFAREKRLGLRRLSPPQSPVADIVAAGTLHRSSNSTAIRQCTREPIKHVGDRLSKHDTWPKLCSTHHRYQTTTIPPPPLPSEASQQRHGQATIQRSPSHSRLWDDAPRRRKTQKCLHCPSCNDPKSSNDLGLDGKLDYWIACIWKCENFKTLVLGDMRHWNWTLVLSFNLG
jgi:hypothetical protein